MSTVMDRINDKISFKPVPYSREDVIRIAPALRMLLRKNETSIVVFKTNDLVSQYIEDEKEFYSIFSPIKNNQILNKILIPAYIVKYKDIDKQYRVIKEELNRRMDVNIIAIQDTGVFSWGGTKVAADKRMALFLDLVKVKKYSSLNNKINFSEIENTLFQSYGKVVLESQRVEKNLSEKIAIVTGAAQGFGKGIAESLAKEGANVILADLNEDMARENASKLNREYGQGKFLALEVDVANEDYVKNMIWETVAEYGGIDIFISNAGVLKAGSLESMDLESFELSTKVNYTAFFLCTKYASEPMKIQYRFNQDYFSDIIQINSKSGLEGSKKNFAYAGSKFGGIGLTQSFALELMEYNIKVNAVCPGNFFEGPLWSDPEEGLFIQYLRSNKVPGARTIKDVRKFYESKIPMKRGCQIEDIAKAIFYIIDQKYETGQVIPVTGGQIMLR
ncbi:3-phenylpropionate-dihydrodiol/cinnamic acid-dihydrodiol dehydrogenase [subsurface metagenome]